MKLNKEVWTAGREVRYSNGKMLVPDIGTGNSDTTFYSLVTNGHLTLNTEIDQSIMLGVVFNGKIAESVYCEFDRKNPLEYTIKTQFNTMDKAGIYLAWASIGTTQTQLTDEWFSRARIAFGQSTPQNMTTTPIIQFALTSIVFYLRVLAINKEKLLSNTNPIEIIDVATANATENFDDIYYIAGVAITPYFGMNPNSTRNTNFIYNYYPEVYGVYPKWNGHFSDDVLLPAGNVYNNQVFSIGGIARDTMSYNTVIFPHTPKEYFDVIGSNRCIFTKYKYGISQFFRLVDIFAETGMYYTTNLNTAERAVTGKGATDPFLQIGKITNDGKLTGEPVTGKDTADTPQATWDNPSDFGENNGFNGIDNTDPNNYTDKIDLNKPTLSNVNVFNRSFAVTSNNVRQLADFLWNADETKFQEIVKGLALMGENPMNGIIDLRLFPFNVALKNSATQAEPIIIGRTNTGINGIKLTENVNSLIDLGECTFFEKFKNFLDFEPYTTAQLYIPYIGVVPVSTAEFMGHKISAKMLVDYTTGAGTAIVFKDDIPFIYKNGVVGITIPMTGNDSASYANTVVGNVVNGAIGGISSIASGNIGGVVSSAEKLYSGFATGTNYQTASASAPAISTWQPQKCYFIIDRPVLNVPDNYGRTVGYACEQTGKLSDFKGFTIVSNPEISFKCTEAEKTMLSQLLTSGVFV